MKNGTMIFLKGSKAEVIAKLEELAAAERRAENGLAEVRSASDIFIEAWNKQMRVHGIDSAQRIEDTSELSIKDFKK